MICFFFMNSTPPIRLTIFGAPLSFVAADGHVISGLLLAKIKKNVIYVIGK